MVQIQNLLRERLQMINLLLVTGGFATIVVELFYTGHTNGTQMLGLYAALFGVLLGLHGLIDNSARNFLVTAFLILTLFGLLGAFQHFGVRKTRETLAQIGNQDVGIISHLGAPPLLAPLSISGLALMGMFSLLATTTAAEAQSSKDDMRALPAPVPNR